ncbi:MAG: cytidylate kinase-like family protein [Armatimonadetes bacterium]|nr:cytidylate kinase-like family protein [Armatimonadota bacterium]
MRLSDNSRLTDQRVQEWFLLQKARAKQAETAPKAVRPGPTITISRQFGAGGNSVATRVAALLGAPWTVWDKEAIKVVAENAQIKQEMAQAMDERSRSWVQEMFRDLLGTHHIDSSAYKRILIETLLSVAQQGHKIIVGRGANYVMPQALNVRLEADEEWRVQATMRIDNLNHGDAVKQVHLVDADRAKFVHDVYGKDVAQHKAYDMVLRVDALGGYDTAAAATAAAARAMYQLPDA